MNGFVGDSVLKASESRRMVVAVVGMHWLLSNRADVCFIEVEDDV